MVRAMTRARFVGMLGLSALLSLLLAPAVVQADSSTCSVEQAKKRFDEGMRHLEKGNSQEACRAFEASLACRARASTQTKVAACRENENKLNDALLGYRRAFVLEKNPNHAVALELEIQAHIERLEQRIPRLLFSLDLPVEGLRVVFDERELSADEIKAPLLVDPGTHRIVVNAPGYEERRLEVAVAAGETSSVDLKLAVARKKLAPPAIHLPRAAQPVPELRLAAPPTAESRRAAEPAPAFARADPQAQTDVSRSASESSPQPELQDRVPVAARDTGSKRMVGMVVGGAGLVSLGVASAFAIRTLYLVEEGKRYCYSDDTCDQQGLDILEEARQAQTTGILLGGAGLLALAAGIVVISTHSTAASPGVSPTAGLSRLVVTPTLAGIVARGAF
jgi:hypothetical protein